MSLAKGRIAPKRELQGIRAITREDLPRLIPARSKVGTQPQRLRAAHHLIARLLSTGMPLAEVAAHSGYSINRVSQLANSPAMEEAVAGWQQQDNASWLAKRDLYNELLIQNKMAAERMIADEIEDRLEAGERLSVREALAVARDAADRTGHGKKQTTLNINAELGSIMDRAIARSGITIEGSVVTPQSLPAGASTHASPEPRPSFRRLTHAA